MTDGAQDRLRGLRWTFWALFLPAVPALLCVTFLLPLLALEPFPIHEGTTPVWVYELWFALALSIAVVAAWLGAWWAALLIWRGRLPADEAARLFAWAIKPRSGRFMRQLTRLTQRAIAWILRQAYGRPVQIHEGTETK